MADFNKIIGKNLLLLRKQAKLTQLEFAEKFNYSDKSISKWEAGESLPSVEVLCEVAKFYGVTLDYLTNENNEILPETEQQKPGKVKRPKLFPTKLIVTLLSCCAVWMIATIVFVILKLTLNINYYMAFMWAVPATCVVLVVFNSIWGRFRYLFPALSVLLWTLCASLQIELFLHIDENIWPVYILAIPLQIGIILWGALVTKKPLKKKEKVKTENEEKSV